jgi:hypothetical protein
MKRFSAVLVVALVMASCGGSTETTPGDPLDPGFARTWSGTQTLTCPGYSTTESGTMPITVSGNSLTAILGCLGGSSVALTVTGSGKTVSWSGSLNCPPAADASCSAWVYTRTASTLTLNANGSLTASGAGTLVGCGVTLSCTTSFSGT